MTVKACGRTTEAEEDLLSESKVVEHVRHGERVLLRQDGHSDRGGARLQMPPTHLQLPPCQHLCVSLVFQSITFEFITFY